MADEPFTEPSIDKPAPSTDKSELVADGAQLLASAHRLQSLLASLDSVTQFLSELSVLAAEVVGPSASCGITVRHDDQPHTVTSSDPRAASLDETQYVVGGGPCLYTLATGEIVDIPDMSIETRWPDYSQQARSSGLQCSLSLPISIDNAVFGAMNLYGFHRTKLFDDSVRHRCEIFAGQASGALGVVAGRNRDARLVNQLEQALDSRTVIDQAIGMLMMMERCTADHAFDLLRMRSQSSQRKLRDVAADLIIRITGQPPQPGRPFQH